MGTPERPVPANPVPGDPLSGNSLMRRAARPHLVRAMLEGVVALAGLVAASIGRIRAVGSEPSPTATELALAIAGSTALLFFGIAAIRALVRGVRAATGTHLGDSRAGPLGFVISLLGYFVVIVSALAVNRIDMSGLLLGGALTGVALGIAAQQTLGNFFAGIVLLIVRPFSVGDQVVLRAVPLGGLYEGVVTDMSVFYVRLDTTSGPVQLPNAGVLAAAVGPGARQEPPPA